MGPLGGFDTMAQLVVQELPGANRVNLYPARDDFARCKSPVQAMHCNADAVVDVLLP